MFFPWLFVVTNCGQVDSPELTLLQLALETHLYKPNQTIYCAHFRTIPTTRHYFCTALSRYCRYNPLTVGPSLYCEKQYFCRWKVRTGHQVELWSSSWPRRCLSPWVCVIPAFLFLTRNYIVLLHAMAMPAHGDDFMVPFLGRHPRYPEMDWSGWMVIVQKTVHGAVDKIAKFSCISLLQSVLLYSFLDNSPWGCRFRWQGRVA